tara:strand:+ start:658 stop:990 length:333 start_codon:yes stop_codon:yes gene_type:complete
MQYLYFKEDGKLHLRTKTFDAELAKEFPNPIAVSDGYDITTNGDGTAEKGMPNKREKTRAEIESSITYVDKRISEYPSVNEQLDKIYHNGIDGWKETIKAIKDKYPKESE